MSLNWSRSRLAGLTKELSGHWRETKESWHDAKSLEFEKKFMEELLATVNSTLSNLERLDRIISTIKKDCE